MTMEALPQDLADFLVTKNFDPEYFDKQGQPSEAGEATTIKFDYVADSGKNYGTAVCVISNDELSLYYGDNLGRGMEPEDKDEWYSFLEQLSNQAASHGATWSPTEINKLKHNLAGIAAIKEGLFEGYYGSRKVSYMGEQTQARLVIKHNRVLGENDKRYRYVESLFIETADQERFRLPFKSLAAGRAMLEHVRQGGRPYDVRGNHITEIVSEMAVLSRFNRAQHNRVYEGVTQELVESAQQYYHNLQETMKHLGSPRGYQTYFESWAPDQVGEAEALVENLRNLFVEQTLDARIEAALPTLAKIQQQGNNMKEAQIFENWVNQLSEGTWALPETPEQMEKLNQLMSSELIVGPDATNATEQLYDIVGDDELFDILSDLADRSEGRANCWDDSDVQRRLAELGIQTPESTRAEPSDVEQDEAPDLKENDNPPKHYGGQGPQGAAYDLEMWKRKEELNKSRPAPTSAPVRPIKPLGEEEAQLDEVGDKTLSNYVSKAVGDVADRSKAVGQSAGFQKGAQFATKAFTGADIAADPGKSDSKIDQRKAGIGKAISRMGGGRSGSSSGLGGVKPGQSPSLDNPIQNEVTDDFGPGPGYPLDNQAGPIGAGPERIPNTGAPDKKNYKAPLSDKYGWKPGSAMGGWDAAGQQKYIDRTAPGIINKIKDKLGYDMPDPDHGPRPDERERLVKRYPAPANENAELARMLEHAGVPIKEGVLTDSTGSTLEHIKDRFGPEVREFTQSGEMDNDLYDALYDYYFDDMPYGTKKARTGDPHQWVSNRFADDLGINENLIAPQIMPVSEGSCNMTAEGAYCPEHGLAECGGMYEDGGAVGMPYSMGEGTDDPINYNAAMTGSYYEGKETDIQEGDALLARIKSLALLR